MKLPAFDSSLMTLPSCVGGEEARASSSHFTLNNKSLSPRWVIFNPPAFFICEGLVNQTLTSSCHLSMVLGSPLYSVYSNVQGTSWPKNVRMFGIILISGHKRKWYVIKLHPQAYLIHEYFNFMNLNKYFVQRQTSGTYDQEATV